jgi:glycosyltransferase involved in cell wall biosynthesis
VKILHLTDHYPPALGGIETHVAALAAHQAARGDDVSVLTSTTATADGRHCPDDGPVQVRRAGSVLEGLRVDFQGYDVVHAHVSVVAPFTSPVAARAARQGTATVVTVHSMWNGMGPIPMLAASLSGLRGAPITWTAVSNVAARQLSVRLPGRPEVPVVPNAVDVPARMGSRELGADEPVRLVSTMRIARRKRPLQLLAMFSALRRRADTPVELLIVGDGPLRANFEHRARRLGLRDAVTVTGRLEPPEVLSALSEADVYIAPALLESFGLAALEARCVGLPVVGHADSGMREFVTDGREGWLCESDVSMVERLRVLVEDSDLRWRISEHNRTVAPGLTWQNALEHNDVVYSFATHGSRPLAADHVGG